MIVTMFFHGGSSYAPFDTSNPEDAEEYGSLKDAMDSFAGRVDFDPYYPCTDDSAEAWIMRGRPEDNLGRDYPDWVLRLGPKGGVIRERA